MLRDDFKSFQHLRSMYSLQKLGLDIRKVAFVSMVRGRIEYKMKHAEDTITVVQVTAATVRATRGGVKPVSHPVKYPATRKISAKKYRDVMSLLPCMEEQFHAYYLNLEKADDNIRVPVDDEDDN